MPELPKHANHALCEKRSRTAGRDFVSDHDAASLGQISDVRRREIARDYREYQDIGFSETTAARTVAKVYSLTMDQVREIARLADDGS